jgi:glycosyltransferase involved in cell wall biosynthesis
MWDWNVAVFCRNERASIGRCIESIADASGDRRVLITLIVNGSTDDSAAVALQTAERRRAALAVYTIAFGDKSNAINRFFHDLREPARYYFFVDAYVKIGPAALVELEACLATRSDIVAATGVAANGRTMARSTQPTLSWGGHLHGQLHALRANFLDRFVARGLRLPTGLYCGDGLIGSMSMHDLDTIRVEWKTQRIGASPGAYYEIPMLSPFRYEDLKRQFQRKIRQQRGRLENLAIRSIVYDTNYEGLPEYADDMIVAYVDKFGLPKTSWLDRPFQMLALRRVRKSVRPSPEAMRPVLLRRVDGAPPHTRVQLVPA